MLFIYEDNLIIYPPHNSCRRSGTNAGYSDKQLPKLKKEESEAKIKLMDLKHPQVFPVQFLLFPAYGFPSVLRRKLARINVCPRTILPTCSIIAE